MVDEGGSTWSYVNAFAPEWNLHLESEYLGVDSPFWIGVSAGIFVSMSALSVYIHVSMSALSVYIHVFFEFTNLTEDCCQIGANRFLQDADPWPEYCGLSVPALELFLNLFCHFGGMAKLNVALVKWILSQWLLCHFAHGTRERWNSCLLVTSLWN